MNARRGIVGLVAVLLVAAGALALRLPRLELRPFHVDEAVQAVKAGELLDSGRYRYDPFEFHGPSLYYLTLPALRLGGARSFAEATDAEFRVVPVVFGAGLLLWLLPLRKGLGEVATVAAAVLLAVSPALVFYSRYYIQETLLVFFGAMALAAGWRWLRTGGSGWCFLLGAAAGLMHATKETGAIFLASLAAAGAAVVWRRRARAGRPWWRLDRRRLLQLAFAAGTAVLVASLFYSSFLTEPRGPLDSLLAFRHYLGRSGGAGSEGLHRHPWDYYLRMLLYFRNAPGPWWSEGLILALAAAGYVAVARRRLGGAVDPELALFVGVYAFCMTAVFSLIPYKTPWNMLGFLHGLILMAGIGAGAVWHGLRWPAARGAWVLLLAAAMWQLGVQAVRANFRFCADPRNPYAYVHSAPDVVRLARRIEEVAALHAEGAGLPVHFMAPEYWPLPYYLRRMRRVGWWTEIPADPEAPLMVVDADWLERLEPLLRERYHREYYGLRPGVLVVLHVRQDIWERFLATRGPKPESSGGGLK